jgi:hypothetical protein
MTSGVHVLFQTSAERFMAPLNPNVRPQAATTTLAALLCRVTLAGLFLPFGLVACGGGDSAPLTPRANADAAEALSRSLIETGLCTADSQCGFVTFQTPFPSCSQGEHAPYLLASENAPAVIAAAADQRQWALKARALEPSSTVVCAGFVEPPPIPICVQSQCTLKSGFVISTPSLQ